MQALPGASASVFLTVTPADTAPAFRSGDVAVLATPRLLALCEQATVAALAPFLEATETTVGSRVELEHLAPARPGDRIRATVVLERVDGPRLTFAVTAHRDDTVVGRGVVDRVVVDRRRFPGGAGGPGAEQAPGGRRPAGAR